jgi:hypothetical protein
MTLKNSFFKIGRSDLHRRIWLVAISVLGCLLAILVPYLAFQSELVSHISEYDRISDFFVENVIYFFQNEFHGCAGILALAMGFLCAVSGFRFLHSRKESDLIHSLPVSRKHFFWVIYVDGMLIWAVPYVVSSLLITVISMVFLKAVPLGVLQGLCTGFLSSLLLFCIIYHFCMACMMLSGNMLNALTSIIVFGTGIAFCYGLLDELFTMYVYRFVSFSLHGQWVFWLSPLVSGVFLLVSMSSDSVNMMPFWQLILGSILLMFINLGLAWRWYITRPSELAERGIENKWIQLLIRFMVTFLASIASGAIFHTLLWGTNVNALGFSLFGCFVGALLGFGVSNMIFRMSFRGFLQHKVQMALCTAGVLVLYICIANGWFGYGDWVPSEEHIKSATIAFSNYTDNSYRFYVNDQQELTYGVNQLVMKDGKPSYAPMSNYFDNYLSYGNMNLEDAQVIHQTMMALSQKALSMDRIYVEDRVYETVGSQSPYQVNVMVTLDNGISMYRSYNLSKMYFDSFWSVINDPSYRYHMYRLSENQLVLPDVMQITDLQGVTYPLESQKDMEELMEAYEQDFNLHYTPEELGNGVEIGSLAFQYKESIPGDGSNVNNSSAYRNPYQLSLYATYENTLAVLHRLCPQGKFTWEDLQIGTILLELHPLLTGQSEDTVCSWYGLEGYAPSEETMDRLIRWNTTNDMTSSAQLLITDPEEIQELSGFLQPGSSLANASHEVQYLSVGAAYSYKMTFSNSETYEESTLIVPEGTILPEELTRSEDSLVNSNNGVKLYVKVGALPKKWIERILAGE